jgi:ABC-type nitrate/sulfonate/bicarbonate transport system substrate-binding protein
MEKLMKKKTDESRNLSINIAGAILVVISLFLLGYLIFDDEKITANPYNSKPLVVGYQNSPAMALIMIAEEQGLFKEHNLDINLREFTAGKFALQTFLGGSLDVAVAGDMPIGLALLQGQKLTAFAEVISDSVDEVRMIVHYNGDCADLTPKHYFSEKKRKIATSFGGGPQFFTLKFLQFHKIPGQQVDLISQAPEQMVGALEKESVDGIAIFDPAASTAEERLSSAVCTFEDPKNYRQHYIAVAHPDLVANESDPRLLHFVQALKSAAEFAKDYPEKSMNIIMKKTEIPLTIIQHIWPKLTFEVELDHELPSLWMEQAIFHLSQVGANYLTPKPDYSDSINSSIIQRLKN